MKKRILGLLMATLCISSLIMADASIKVLAAGDSSEKVVSLSADQKLSFPEEGIVNATMIPGDTVKQGFVFKNSSKEPVTVYMSQNLDVVDKDGKPIKEEAGKDFKNDLLKIISLKIDKEDGSNVYTGPCSGKKEDWNEGFKSAYDIDVEIVSEDFFKTETKKGVTIGTIPSGGELKMTATIHMDGNTIGNEWENVYTLFNWEFYCNGLTPESGPGGPGGNVTPTNPTDPKDPTNPTDEPTEPTDPSEDPTDIDDPDVPMDDKDLDDDKDDDKPNADIEDDDVPKTHIEINDDDVPMNDTPTLAKTGFGLVYVKEAGIVVLVLIGIYSGVTLLEKKKKVRK